MSKTTVIWACAFIVGLSAGCSATETISKLAEGIRSNATGIRADVSTARQNLKDGKLPEVDANLVAIDSKAQAIEKSSSEIQTELTHVQDRVPYWLSTIKWVAGALVGVILLFLAWRLNLLIMLEKFIQWLVTLGAKLLGA